MIIHFLAAVLAVFAFGAAFFGFGDFGFLAAGVLVVFFTLLGELGDFFFGEAFGFSIFTFGLVTFGFFGEAADGFSAFGFFALGAAAAFGFFALATVGFFGFFSAFFVSGTGSLNEPEAPLPFVRISLPPSTALFRYFLMNGDNFSASTL